MSLRDKGSPFFYTPEHFALLPMPRSRHRQRREAADKVPNQSRTRITSRCAGVLFCRCINMSTRACRTSTRLVLVLLLSANEIFRAARAWGRDGVTFLSLFGMWHILIASHSVPRRGSPHSQLPCRAEPLSHRRARPGAEDSETRCHCLCDLPRRRKSVILSPLLVRRAPDTDPPRGFPV